MDATVTAKFFRVIKPEMAAPNTEKVLRDLGALDLVERQIDIGESVVMRLENLEEDAGYLSGQFCRKQMINLPPTADDAGLEPMVLGEGKGLGHVAAFRYHIQTQILLLQVNQQSATPNRISLYLSAAAERPIYSLEPVLKKDAFKRMKSREIKAFSVKIAEPQNLKALDDPKASAFKGVRAAARAFNAREIEIIVYAGAKKKKEKKRPLLLQLASRQALTRLATAGDDIKSLQAQIIEDGTAPWIDLLEQQVKETRILNLDSHDPPANYLTRKAFLTQVFHANIGSLKELYGPNNGGN